MFKKKPYIVLGKDKKIHVPRPPKHATHVVLEADEGGRATVALRDFDTLWGCGGWITFKRLDNKLKVKEEYPDEWYWTGTYIEGIQELLDN